MSKYGILRQLLVEQEELENVIKEAEKFSTASSNYYITRFIAHNQEILDYIKDIAQKKLKDVEKKFDDLATQKIKN